LAHHIIPTKEVTQTPIMNRSDEREFIGVLSFNLIVYWYLKTFIIMAKFSIKFLDCNFETDKSILVEADLLEKEIFIGIKDDISKEFISIYLDKSTAIKFAKTLRTEINKITELEGGQNG
jgi:hypothetical protein